MSMLPLNEDKTAWSRSWLAGFTHTCPMLDMFPPLVLAPVPPIAPGPSLLCKVEL